MKNIFFASIFILALQACSTKEYVLEFEPNQSMIVTGKGQGQDAAINPYLDRTSIAIVRNIGLHAFEVRLQKAGNVLDTRLVQPSQTIQFKLDVGVELYIDCTQKSTASVLFKKG